MPRIEYEQSIIMYTWERDGVRYRRGITRDGRQFVERGENGRYVLDHIRE
jgi:hypothetical protein